MEDAGMIMQLRDDTEGIRGLGEVDKVYMDNIQLPTMSFPDSLVFDVHVT